MLRSPYPSPSRRASSHEGERSSTHSTTESRSPRKSERPSSSVAAARGCAHGARGRITLPMSLGPCVISRRVRVGSADHLTIVVPIETFSRRARRRRRRDGGRALGRSELHHEGQLLSRVSRHAPRAHRAIRLADRGGVGSGTTSITAPPPVVPVVAGMVVAPLVARLVERVAAAAASAPPSITVLGPAVDLPAVAAPADVEDALAPRASPLPTDLRVDLVHRRSDGATVSCLPGRPRRRSPTSGTVTPLRPEGSGSTDLSPPPFVTPTAPNLPATPRRGPVRVGSPRISVIPNKRRRHTSEPLLAPPPRCGEGAGGHRR